MRNTLWFIFWGLVILYFPAAILAYTFIPALAPLIPLKQLVCVVIMCAIYVVAAAQAQRKLIDEVKLQQSANNQAWETTSQQTVSEEDELANEFE